MRQEAPLFQVLFVSLSLLLSIGFSEVKRMSRPGLRAYSGTHDIPMIRNGLGVVIVSTSQGVMTDMQAKDLNIGGELICSVF